MIYLDNSATTFPKPKVVISAVMDGIKKYGANPGRSGHSFSLKTAMKISEIREKLAAFVGAESGNNVIITSGCTEALNLAILGTCQKGGHIVVTACEHNSVLRPVFELQRLGLVEVSIAKPTEQGKLTAQDVMKVIQPNTYLVCVNHISNVDGMQADVDGIGRLCNEKCITFLLDGAQSVGHIQIDMTKQHIDMLAVAPHKGLYALTGVGALITSNRVKLKPIRFGGTGTESYNLQQPTNIPDGFESGTQAVPNIISMGAGIDFVSRNFSKIRNKIADLTSVLNYELRQIEGVTVYTHPDNATGVLSFNIRDIPSSEVAQILDEKYRIMVRSGLHCAPIKHRTLQTIQQGTVRVSLSIFNTYDEIMQLIRACKQIASNKK